jgi:hypothetical protein
MLFLHLLGQQAVVLSFEAFKTWLTTALFVRQQLWCRSESD